MFILLPEHIIALSQILLIETFENETTLTIDGCEDIDLNAEQTTSFFEKFDFAQSKIPAFLNFDNKYVNLQRFVAVRQTADGVVIMFNSGDEILIDDDAEENSLLDAVENLSSIIDNQMAQMLPNTH